MIAHVIMREYFVDESVHSAGSFAAAVWRSVLPVALTCAAVKMPVRTASVLIRRSPRQ
jgi:hypothetical protein